MKLRVKGSVSDATNIELTSPDIFSFEEIVLPIVCIKYWLFYIWSGLCVCMWEVVVCYPINYYMQVGIFSFEQIVSL